MPTGGQDILLAYCFCSDREDLSRNNGYYLMFWQPLSSEHFPCRIPHSASPAATENTVEVRDWFLEGHAHREAKLPGLKVGVRSKLQCGLPVERHVNRRFGKTIVKTENAISAKKEVVFVNVLIVNASY